MRFFGGQFGVFPRWRRIMRVVAASFGLLTSWLFLGEGKGLEVMSISSVGG